MNIKRNVEIYLNNVRAMRDNGTLDIDLELDYCSRKYEAFAEIGDEQMTHYYALCLDQLQVFALTLDDMFCAN